jgi:hypothetical protein
MDIKELVDPIKSNIIGCVVVVIVVFILALWGCGFEPNPNYRPKPKPVEPIEEPEIIVPYYFDANWNPPPDPVVSIDMDGVYPLLTNHLDDINIIEEESIGVVRFQLISFWKDPNTGTYPPENIFNVEHRFIRTYPKDPLYPECWTSPTQCYGDITGDGKVTTADWASFRDGFGGHYPQTKYKDHVCGDYNRDGSIDGSDWPMFRDNFGWSKTLKTDCVPGGHWPPYSIAPEEFNPKWSPIKISGRKPIVPDFYISTDSNNVDPNIDYNDIDPNVNFPVCWSYPYHCYGDLDGDANMTSLDWDVFKNGYGSCFPEEKYIENACADFNKNGCVDNGDWEILRNSWVTDLPAEACSVGGMWPPAMVVDGCYWHEHYLPTICWKIDEWGNRYNPSCEGYDPNRTYDPDSPYGHSDVYEK